jgi:hypothetical protein
LHLKLIDDPSPRYPNELVVANLDFRFNGNCFGDLKENRFFLPIQGLRPLRKIYSP